MTKPEFRAAFSFARYVRRVSPQAWCEYLHSQATDPAVLGALCKGTDELAPCAGRSRLEFMHEVGRFWIASTSA